MKSPANATPTTEEPKRNRGGRPRLPQDKLLVRKYIGLLPADLAKLEVIEAQDPEYLIKKIRAWKQPKADRSDKA